MAMLNDVYCKFGEVSEAGQLLETELGNITLAAGLPDFLSLSEQERGDGSLVQRFVVDKDQAGQFVAKVTQKTLGQLIQLAKPRTDAAPHLQALLLNALKERNRLSHHFYRQHNLRKNSEAGRSIMVDDLEAIHVVLIEALKALYLLNGFDLEDAVRRAGQSPAPDLDADGGGTVAHLPI